jgi:phosphotransacetylase
MARAVQLLRERDPAFQVGGGLQADSALNAEKLRTTLPFSALKEPANVLILPA